MVLHIVRDARRAMNTLILLILVFDFAGNDMMITFKVFLWSFPCNGIDLLPYGCKVQCICVVHL
jgi:hypothetical protein